MLAAVLHCVASMSWHPALFCCVELCVYECCYPCWIVNFGNVCLKFGCVSLSMCLLFHSGFAAVAADVDYLFQVLDVRRRKVPGPDADPLQQRNTKLTNHVFDVELLLLHWHIEHALRKVDDSN